MNVEGLNDPFPPLESRNIISRQIKPLTFASLFVEASVPIRFDTYWVVGFYAMNSCWWTGIFIANCLSRLPTEFVRPIL